MDRVNYSSLCRDSTTDITAEAIQAIGDEKKVEIRRIRWLSKPSEKAYGSVAIFLAEHKDAESLLATGVMDFGSEMTYVKPYERRMLSMRCFKCQQYGQQEARCKATVAMCGNRVNISHTLEKCSSQNTKCAACKGAHKAADWRYPKYFELLRQIDPVDCHA